MRSIIVVVIGVLLATGGALAPADLVQTIDAHYGAVTALDITPDGDVLYTGSKDGRIKLWETESFELIQTVPACQVAVNDLALSSDETYYATAGDDGFVNVWDAYTSELINAIDAHEGGAKAVAVNPDPESPYFYSGGDDGFVRCWNIEDDFALEWEAYAHYYGCNDIILNEAGDYLFSGGVDGNVNVYDALEGILESQIKAYEGAEVLCLQLTHDPEACLYTGGTNGEIRVWDAATGSLVRKIRAHAGNVNYIAFLPDDSLAISGGEDGKIKLWNTDGEMAGEMQAHVLAVRDFFLVEDVLYTGGADYKIRIWNANF